jgi:DNA gyrase/topoisomerase IV subunit B/transcriptional regulator with XRE-family HTH domain
MVKDKEYSAESIQVLEGLEGVKRRPSMYIGSTGKDGLHHLVYEVVDNSVDEALAGYCKKILVTINKNGSVTVVDDGRGIPVDPHPTLKVPAVQVALTKLHAGGKFDKKTYAISGGLHGVGVSVVNALSKKLIIEVRRDGKVYTQEYSRGDPKTKLTVSGKSEGTGTTITFWPDEEIFSTTVFDYKVLETRFREIVFLNPGLRILLVDEEKGKKEEFYSAEGIIEFVKWLNKSKEALHKPVYFRKDVDHTVIEAAIQYNSSYQENIFGFVNTINTVEGGTHVSGFKTALTRVINDYGKKKNLLKNESLSGDDVREGLTVVLSLKMAEPQFEGQTKTKLGNSEIKGFVDSAVTQALGEFFEENPTIARKITQKALESAKARIAAKKAKDLVRRKNAFSLGGLPGKLADCSSKKTENTELYIVEGESAGGCFSEDTKIALADGRNLSFKELVEEDKSGKENFCYTIKKDGSIGLSKIKNPRLTKRNVEVIKIVLDNGKEIVCTPDHKFMLRGGSYREAKFLTKKDSLMPLNKKISKIGGRITIGGYEMVWDPCRRWIFTHMLSDEYNLEKGIYLLEQGNARHHIDFNKRNNNPTNIIRLPKNEHLILHTENLDKTIHREDIKEKARQAHRTQEYRKKMSDWAKTPDVNNLISKNSKKLWENEEYKKYMVKKFKEFYNSNKEYRRNNNELLYKNQKKYWQSPENRIKASEKVRKFFEENPDAKEYLSNLAKDQWKDDILLVWRRQKTKEQWTPEFRKRRIEAYNKTYYRKTISLMKQIIEKYGNLDNFDKIRIENKDNSILSLKTFCSRFFDDNSEEMIESIKNHNHKIKKIEWLKEKIDVYDLEVSGTHNFALASGIFVHNSAKMGRDRNIQAILPLKGKILNVEKSSQVKALSSEEIANLITAIGTGVGENFDLKNLRYGKIILMSVDGEEATFVQNNRGIISFVKIGDFIDGLAEKEINPSKYKVLCFNLKTRRTQFKEIKSVIRHPITEKLYEIKTSYGRNVKVTSSHSVFVFEDGRIKLKKGNEIKKGDKIVAPKLVPLYNYNLNSPIDVLSVFVENKEKINENIYVRGKTVEGTIRNRIKETYRGKNELVDNRVVISGELGNIMAEKRREIEISQKELCKKIGIRQPCIYYDWEKGKSKPSFKNFEKYIDVLGINKEQAISQVQIVSSKLESTWEKQYKNSGRNKLKDYIKLKEVNQDDLVSIGDDVKLCPVHYKDKGINRFIQINDNLAKLIGFWVAEGSCSLRNGIRMSIGNNDLFLVPEFKEAFVDVFGLNAKLTKFNRNSAELKLVNKAASLFWKCLFGFETYRSHTKKIPNIIFNVSKELQLEFLRCYFLGDGTISKNGISFTTVSKDLANQLMYLLLSHGVVSGISCREPSENKKIISKEKVYTVNVTSKNGLLALKRVWESHRNSYYLKDKLDRKSYLFNKSSLEISDDLIALEVKDCGEVKPSNGQVYDFSVDEDENFIAGFGGLCCHNSDADIDGEHIKTLLLTFFYRFMPHLIENGNVFVALPPLFRIRKGQRDFYVYSEEELKKEISDTNSGNVTRFKGLGEMSSTQLWETTMNPKSRKIKKIYIEDAVEADRVFSMLMGDDVPARKAFIQENAQEANLDI